MIFHYWFLNNGFKFQDYVCNSCHDTTMLYLSISNISIVTVKGVDYRCVIHDINKYKAIRLLKNVALNDFGYI